MNVSKVSLRTAARRLGVRDQMAAYELLWAAEARMFRIFDNELYVDAADLDALVSIHVG